jgi:hypothetical protein
MATPAPAAPADQPARGPEWLVLTASERGASHNATQAPNQDSVGSQRAGSAGMVAAVADGHGHSRHLRSARGSRLAVYVGCQVAQELADKIEARSDLLPVTNSRAARAAAADSLTELVSEFLVPQVVSRWRDVVLADVADDPFTEAEEDLRLFGDDPTVAYGSTLLLGVAVRDWLILAQIGDGDVVVVRPDGRAILPVPTDPQLDGLVTTSLCGADAESDFRVAIVDTTRTSLLAVLLATDGYGNAQVVEQWPNAFSTDLAWLLKERDVHWLASQLPAWAARCASAEGSADDATVALLLSPAGLALTPKVPQGPAGSGDPEGKETTVPAFPRTGTVPVDLVPAGLGSGEPATIRQAAVSAADHGTTTPAGAEMAVGQAPAADAARPAPATGPAGLPESANTAGLPESAEAAREPGSERAGN